MGWDAPWMPSRAAGGLLGVVGGEAWRGSRGGFEHDGPVAAALVDVCRAYTDVDGEPPRVAAARHEGVPGVAWLLPVALIVNDAGQREREVRRLAAAAGVASYALPACLAYVEVASRLFAASPSGTVVRWADRTAVPARPRPRLCGVGAVDGLTAGTWAVAQPDDLTTVLSRLIEWADEPVAPWVAAAAAGLLGLRDGCVAIPAHWHRRLRSGQRHACQQMAQALAVGQRSAS
jgi:hypothetical protein